ncbi:MAG: DUF4340 domain-containing protein [Planctomycetota bacterium]|jgi:hypothetical protein
MSARPTIVVLVVAVIGVAAAVWVWRGEQTPPPSSGQRGALLAGGRVPVDAVTRITLRRGGDPAMVFEPGEGGWTQTEPFAHPMDAFSIRQLVVLATALEIAKRLDGERSEADLGLRPPRAELVYEWPEGSLALRFGRRGVAGRSYVQVDGDPTVYVVTGELPDRAVDMDPKEWRDRTIFSPVGVDADQVVILDGPSRTVLRRDRKQWEMVEPVRTRLDETARDELFGALGRARSGGFILDEPDDPSTFGLAEPSGSVTITSTQLIEQAEAVVRVPRVERLLVGGRMGVGSEDRFGMIDGRPVVVQLPEPVLRALFRRPETLVDPTGSGVMAADVISLVIRGPDGEVRLDRDLDRWSAPEYGAEVSLPQVQDLLEQLTTLRAAQIEIRPYPRELELATIIMRGQNARPLDTVRVAREPRTGRLALENGDDVLRILPPEAHLALTPAEFGLEEEGTEGLRD